jgi:hypothetical protein
MASHIYASGTKKHDRIRPFSGGLPFCCYALTCRGVAQPGSAPSLGAGGPRFKSGRPTTNLLNYLGLFLRRISTTIQLGNIWEQLVCEHVHSVSLGLPLACVQTSRVVAF